MLDMSLPLRKAQIMARFEDSATVRKDNDRPFDKVIYEQIEIARTSVNDEPRFFYIVHEKMDAELNAIFLDEKISREYGDLSVFLNAAFRGNKLSHCINKRSLKSVAKSRDLWHHTTLTTGSSLLHMAAWIVSTVISLVSLFISFFSPGNMALEVLRSHHIESFLLFLGILCCAISLLLLRKLTVDRDKMALEALDKVIDSMPDAEFLAFLENFSAEDFRLLGLKSWQENINVICPLSRYTPRQRAILKRYWMTTSNGERWWIFIEQKVENAQYILDKSDHYGRHFIFLRPLEIKVKRDVAKRLGRDVHDPGLREYGIDYVASSLLHIGITPPDITLSQRMDDFVTREQSNFPVAIMSAIYLVAELSVKYRIDFTSGRYWEYLFEYSSKPGTIIDLDRQVSKEYFFSGVANGNTNDLNSLRYLIPLILNEFSDDLGNIAILHASQVQLSCFSQLCLIKALRCRKNQDEGRVLAIAETLYYTMKETESAPETFCKRRWIDIFTETLTFFKAIYYGCFSPAFLHMLINIFDKSKDKQIEKLFSLPVVLWTAKANLLLNNSTDVEEELTGQAIDVIYDHF